MTIEFKPLNWSVYESACIRLGVDPTETLTTIHSLSAVPDALFVETVCERPPEAYSIEIGAIVFYEWLRIVQGAIKSATERATPTLARLPQAERGDRTITGALARMEPADEHLFRKLPLDEFLYRLSLRSAYATLDALKNADDPD